MRMSEFSYINSFKNKLTLFFILIQTVVDELAQLKFLYLQLTC